MMKYVLTFLMVTIVLASSASAAFTEIGDAGSTVGTAQIATATGDPPILDGIIGILTVSSDVDAYKIWIQDTATFEAKGKGKSVGAYLDIWYPTLSLFDDEGTLLGTDAGDTHNTNDPATIGGNAAWEQGYYFVAMSAGGTSGDRRIGGYQIDLTSAYSGDFEPPPPPPPPPPPVIPAPGAVVLCSLGAGLVGWLRRRGAF